MNEKSMELLGYAIGIIISISVYYLVFRIYLKKKKERKEIEEKRIEEQKLLAINRLKQEENDKRILNEKLKKVDRLKKQLDEIQDISIINISDYKNLVIENEKNILNKGGDDQLFMFMKISSFLNDFSERISKDKIELKNVLDIKWLKASIVGETKRTNLDKIAESLKDASLRIDGKNTIGLGANIDKLFILGDVMKSSFENQIKTLEFYKNMGIAMLLFYLNDKKIGYFEINQAFESLGVFDSSWQKNVLNKLDSIDIRLSQIGNQLSELNKNFNTLVESNELVINELKSINSNLASNNLLLAITAYQTWRISKHTKNIKL